MNSAKPPRLAARILQEFGPELNQEALAGDLNEAFQQGRSKGWYWRQVLAATRWSRLVRMLVASVLLAWWIAFDKPGPTLLSRWAEMVVLATAYLASFFAPGIKRGWLRVSAMLLLAAAFGLLCFYKPYPVSYWIFLWILACNLVSDRKVHGRIFRPVTLRELVFRDPNAERQRLMEKLQLAMQEETDPKARRAYEESIAALRRHESTDAKAT